MFNPFIDHVFFLLLKNFSSFGDNSSRFIPYNIKSTVEEGPKSFLFFNGLERKFLFFSRIAFFYFLDFRVLRLLEFIIFPLGWRDKI